MAGRMLRAPTRGQPGVVAAASRCQRPEAPNKGQIHGRERLRGLGTLELYGAGGAVVRAPLCRAGLLPRLGVRPGAPSADCIERRFPAKRPQRRLGLLQNGPKESRSPPAEPSAAWELPLTLPLSLQVFHVEIQFLATHFG